MGHGTSLGFNSGRDGLENTPGVAPGLPSPSPGELRSNLGWPGGELVPVCHSPKRPRPFSMGKGGISRAGKVGYPKESLTHSKAQPPPALPRAQQARGGRDPQIPGVNPEHPETPLALWDSPGTSWGCSWPAAAGLGGGRGPAGVAEGPCRAGDHGWAARMGTGCTPRGHLAPNLQHREAWRAGIREKKGPCHHRSDPQGAGIRHGLCLLTAKRGDDFSGGCTSLLSTAR